MNDCLWDTSGKHTSPMFSVSKGFRSFEMVLMDSTRSTLQTPALTACYKKESFLRVKLMSFKIKDVIHHRSIHSRLKAIKLEYKVHYS